MTPLLLIAAVDTETKGLLQLLQDARPLECAQHSAWHGQLHGHEVLLLAGGVGKTNAAASTAVALERFAPHGVISFGSAGAYRDSGLRQGDLVLASESIAADEGVACADTFLDFEVLGFPSVARPEKRYNRFPAPPVLHVQAAQILADPAARLGVALRCGASLTVSSCSGSSTRGDLLAARWQGVCENMEGAAVAQVCSAWGIPWLEVRAISNLVEDRDTSTWNLPLACEHVQEAVCALVEHLPPKEWLA
ncbi:MAG: futalosine hydrolase [Desulfuromonas sp.]|nr:MAG: futalosine hydrolase [Desulfuromonas sp.]